MMPFLRTLCTATLCAATLLPAATAPVAAQSSLLDYGSIVHPVVDEDGMVVSQNEIASRVGAEILAAGGNAVDAAIATGFALAVTLPRAGNLGGSGYMLVYIAEEDRVLALDYRSAAPADATVEMFLDRRGRINDAANYGHRAAAVPGTVAGFAAVHERYGVLPWADLIAPAMSLAQDGIVVSRDPPRPCNGASGACPVPMPPGPPSSMPMAVPTGSGSGWFSPISPGRCKG